MPVYIDRLTSTLYLSGTVDQSSEKTPTSDRQRDHFQKELKLNISTGGFVYHPALLTYRLQLRPEFRWTDSESQGNKSSSSSEFLGYNIQTTWLRNKPYTLYLGAQQARTEFSSLLAAPTVNESSLYSAGLSIKSRLLPTTISYQNSDNGSGGYYLTQTNDERWELSSIHTLKKSKTELNIEQNNLTRSIGDTSVSSERFRTRLSNRYKLDNDGSIKSAFSFHEGTRLNEHSTSAGIESQLLLNHRHNLQSNYSARFGRRDDEDRFSRSTALSAGLRHQLYENLRTSVTWSGSKNDSNAGPMNSYGGGLSVGYTRRIPWGQLRIDHREQRSIRDDRRTATFVSVQDAEYAFEGITTFIILEDINIDADSIVLTDTTGLVIYVPGIDYDVDVLGSTTIIARSSFGGIADGQTVIVDYLFAANPPAKTKRSTTTSGVHLSLWEHLSISYSVSHSDEQVVEGAPPEFPLDSESRTLGAQLHLGRSRTRLEFRDMDSARNPRKSRNVTETIEFRPGTSASFNLSASYSQVELKDTGETSKGYGIGAGLGWGFGRWGALKASAFVRRNRSSLRHQEQTGVRADYRWRFGAWWSRIDLRLQDDVNEFEDMTLGRRTIFFETRRRFN